MKKGFFALLMVALAPSVFAQTTAQTAAAADAQQPKRSDSYYHFSLARLRDAEGRFTEAIDEYKKALDLDPKDSNLYSQMAQTYLKNSRIGEATAAANKAVEISPDNIDAHMLLSQIYWQTLLSSKGKPSDAQINSAIHEYEEIIRIDPADPQAFLLLGQLYQVINQPDKAEAIYKKHLKGDPGSEEGVLALAELHVKAGDNKGAAVLLEDFLKSRPDSDRAAKELGDAYFALQEYGKAADNYRIALALGTEDQDVPNSYAQALFMDERFDEAAAVFEKLLKEDPNDGATLLRLAQIYRRTMKFDKARETLETADKLVPNNPEIQFNLYLVDRDEGKLEDALSRLGKLAESSRHSNAKYTPSEQQNRMVFLTNLAVLNSSLGHYDQAVQAYLDMRPIAPEKDRIDAMIVETYRTAKNQDKAIQYLQTVALKESPNSRPLQIISADMIAEKGKVEEGIKALESLSKGGQPDIELYSAMSEIYQRAKKWDDAQAVLERAIRSFPMESEVYFLQGAMYEKQKKDAEAEKAFRRALELDTDNPSPATLNYLGYMFADRGIKLDEALTMIQKAVDSDPISGAYLDSLGWVYYKMNRLTEAEQYLKKAVRFASTDSTMHDHLGDLYNKIMKYPEAASEWQKAIQLANEPKEADPIKKKLDQIKNKVPKNRL
jgi:tetratricopeptide (TPR) repeat protein